MGDNFDNQRSIGSPGHLQTMQYQQRQPLRNLTQMKDSVIAEMPLARTETAFKHFGPLQKQKMGAGPRILSTLLVGGMLSLLILFSLAHAKEIKEEVRRAELTYTNITPEPPPPPPPAIHIPPPPPTMEVHTAPRITVPHEEPAPVVKPPELKMNIPVPVIPAAPPKRVAPAPAPKMVAITPAPAAVPNRYNAPSAVSLGDPNALRAANNARPKAGAVSLGLAGMPASNNGAGTAGARTVTLGSGSPNGSAGSNDRGRAVSGVSLGVAGGQGNSPSRSTSTVALGNMGPANSPQRALTAAPTTAVNILYTPHPAYTSEATAKHITGIVDVEVIFKANGSVQVIRVVRGLGYGLDQSAMAAAANIRFKPAMQNGQPIDQHSTIHIQFQMIS